MKKVNSDIDQELTNKELNKDAELLPLVDGENVAENVAEI